MSPRTRLAAKALQAAKSTSAAAAVAAPPPPVPVARAAQAAPSPATPPIQLFDHVAAWETWLEANHTDPTGLWLKISKKGSGIASVSYDEALDAALCFGWIDGQKKSHDGDHFLQRFTPRRKRSMWSKRNCAKVAVLVETGRMRQAGQAEIDAAKADGRWEKAYSSASLMEVPEDFQAALGRNKKAKAFFEGLGKTKRYAFLWRIATVKREETRQKKIEQFVGLLSEGKTL
ncbi:bacteriocin-protection, YdeI or OmpD-associated-domain-containing protein [Chaetomium fimeti]|uniref:Bacteriocin-protection, YdeI or OmpD-associated-domain-containing protein n=1 Tax=Chaetomium fimeti TaxID=1854472 RepID=A0AAE0HFT9_9PEZI|nr:bacteriocin-protection, YdeI or OmpD-associated-domain-containing protein [Chaetomium fimeti]